MLYWHWSPSDGWAMNMQIRGWNEGLIVYVLAASSPTHPISADAYHKGWASGIGGGLPVNGPLFFAHYSFLGLDPRGLSDRYCADYFAHNAAHARYNYDYCVRNPQGHAGYSSSSWGLTASDIPNGYAASSPSNDKGVIAPTAALASMPYTPEESLAALRTFYYIWRQALGQELRLLRRIFPRQRLVRFFISCNRPGADSCYDRELPHRTVLGSFHGKHRCPLRTYKTWIQI